MPNILFVSNNISHWPLSNTTTEAGTFDSSRVDYAIVLERYTVIASPMFVPTSGNVTWLHHRLYFDTVWQSGVFQLIRAFDVNGVELFSIDKLDNNSEYLTELTLYRPGGSATDIQSFPFNKFQINSVDIRYENDGAEVNLSLYVNGGLAAYATWTGAVSYEQPAYFTLGAVFTAQGSGTVRFSEIIIADTDTRNARLNILRPTATGGRNDWIGEALELADDDPTSGMTSILAEERQSLTLSAYDGASNISSVVLATQSLAGVNGPQNMRHTIRLSAVDYDGPDDLPLGETLQYGLTDFQTNPATSLPWVAGDLATMEMGFISKA